MRRTGKTHTAVNFAAVQLSRPGTVLVTAKNQCALDAFAEKLPSQLLKLCINMASCAEGGVAELHGALEVMQLDLSNIMAQAETFKNDIAVGLGGNSLHW